MLGDAWEADVSGARAAGIHALWFNRRGLPSPDAAVREIASLEPAGEVLDDPSSAAARNLVIGQGNSLAGTINNLSTRVLTVRNELNSRITASADEIATTLTMIGLEVESVEDTAKSLKPFVVAHVVSAEPHPNSDHLKVCKVDAGTGSLIDVVCGAPNAETGMKSVFAFPGTYIPGKDFTLKEGVVIRGQVSNGMLCSAAELELSNDHEGIIRLPDDAPVGMSYVEYAKIGGVVIDISITPNRGDATGIYGVARDLAAYGLGTLDSTERYMSAVPSVGPSPIPPLPQQFGASEPKAIRKFAGRYIRGVKNGPSPEWLQARLRAVGLRPINALADITNFVSQGWGRPLHAYDADKVVGAMLLRNARAGEKLDGLDGREHVLDETMCVIADDQGPLCLGGILGGWLYQHGGLGLVFVGCALLGVFWLLAAATMREPPYVTSLRRPLAETALADSGLVGRLLAIPGVSDAIVVAEEAALYIKVDTQQLDRALLEQVLEEAAETHTA